MPPEQRAPLEEFRPYAATRVIRMDDPDATAFFVQDIDGLEANWRWTGQRPTVRVRPRTKDGVHFVIDFTMAEATLKETGPVNISFYVGDHLLGSERYSTPGAKHFEKPVPGDWIAPGEDLLLAAETDKAWVAKADGAKLGFVLSSIGLTQP